MIFLFSADNSRPIRSDHVPIRSSSPRSISSLRVSKVFSLAPTPRDPIFIGKSARQRPTAPGGIETLVFRTESVDALRYQHTPSNLAAYERSP